MGGQIAYPDSIHLDMLKFDRIQYNSDWFGSLIESINYLKLVNADGQEIRCGCAENVELFRAGGVG